VVEWKERNDKSELQKQFGEEYEMVKNENQDLLNNVRHHIQNAFGNDISSDEFISPDGDSVTIVSCKNGMQPGVTAHATLGVCLYPKPSLQQGEHIAHEFIGVENEDDDIVREILSTCAYCVMDGMSVQPFSCWANLLPLYMPKSKLKHVFFLPAYLWGDKLLMSNFENITVFYLLVCPLSDKEADFVSKFHDNSVGIKNLIEKMEKKKAYIFDFNREPIF
jgi:hypothetical protein